ncbi:MAG: hypothetical protein HKN58_11490 [Xanthomonadales bacterium]|nr:hypothetical protein [Xanthomonadales bacterium]
MMTTRFPIATCLLIAVTLLPGHALAAQGESLADQLEAMNLARAGAVNRISYHQINGWTQLEDKYVVVHAGDSGDFLLRLRNRCKHLDPAMDVSFTASAGYVTTADRINVENESGFRDFCYISTITRLERR